MRVFKDTWIMFKRSMKISLRNPDAFGQAIVVPAFLMWMFATIFSASMDVGYGINYIDFIVPAVILQTVSQAVASTAIWVNTDINKGIVDRFRSMPITKSALLSGHVLASVVRNLMSTAIVIGVAFAVGFRPQAGVWEWLAAIGIIVLLMFALTWIAVIAGVKAKSPENTTGYLFILFLLPFISSGFAPTESLPNWIRWFAENQPMTPIINSLRSLWMGVPSDGAILTAIIWSASITIVAAVVSVQLYKRKLK